MTNHFLGDVMTVKNRLREIRHERYINTQKEMAQRLEIAQHQYNRYENQQVQPTLEQALRIALYDAKLINRMRFPGEPYIWFIKGSKYSTKMIHCLTIVDVLIEIFATRPQNLPLDNEIEYQQGNLITDLFLSLRNDFRGVTKKFFIEVHLNSSENIFAIDIFVISV